LGYQTKSTKKEPPSDGGTRTQPETKAQNNYTIGTEREISHKNKNSQYKFWIKYKKSYYISKFWIKYKKSY
jgi:hypothetical protein